VSFMTDFLFRMVCRGLFQKHRLPLSFLLAAAIELHKGSIDRGVWSYLLRGSLHPQRKHGLAAKPKSAVITNAMWLAAADLSANAPRFKELAESIIPNLGYWEQYASCEEPWSLCVPLGEATSAHVTPFEHLLLIQCFQPQKLLQAIGVCVFRLCV
jgi:dynein heavy chain, axonemal